MAARNLTLAEAQDVAIPWRRSDSDVEIRIWLVNDSSAAAGRSLRFELTAPAFGLQEKPFGPHPLASEPQSYFERFYGRISALDGDGPDQLAPLCSELTDLLPQELHDRLWELKDQGLTLWIRPESEAWIPWEILELRVKEGGRWERGPLLCEAFRITRWPAGVPCRRHLPVRRLAAVLGRFSGLPALPEEQQFLEGLQKDGRAVEILPPVREEVLAAMESGLFDAWHFASHGEWLDSDPTGAEIGLARGESIKLRDVAHEARNFCGNHPLVVLNACHLGRGGRGLVNWGGWTARLVQMEAGAVLGALWPIDDQAAVRFIRTFYEVFLAGTPLAEAVQRARLETREEFPKESTWLAFTVYGHPLAVCAEPGPHTLDPPLPSPSRRPREAETQSRGAPSSNRRAGTGWRVRSHRLRWAAGGLVLSLVTFAVLAGVRTGTRIELDLPVNGLAFTTGGDKALPLTDAGLPLQSLTVARFAQMEMYPSEIAWLEAPERWRPAVDPPAEVSLVSRDPAAQVSVESSSATSPQAAGSPMITDRLWIEPGSRVVVHAMSHNQGFDLGIEMTPPESFGVSVHRPFILTADFVEVRGLKTAEGNTAGQQTFLRGRLREDRPTIEIFPGNQNLMISGTLGPRAGRPLLSRDLPVKAFELLDQDTDGAWRSTLAGEGRLRYPDQPWELSLTLRAGEFLGVDGLRDFRLTRLDLVRKGGPLRLTLDGYAQKVRSGPQGLARDLRLSLYEQWVRGRVVQSLVAWVSGWIALALGVEELWRRVMGKG
jgi:hypothetical protein